MTDKPSTDLVPISRGQITVQSGRSLGFHSVQEMIEAAQLMAKAGIAVRKHLRENPGTCLAVIMQAHEWEMSPIAVANKSYSVNDQLAYEAQLIHAVILRRAPIIGRPRMTFDGSIKDRTRKIMVSAALADNGEIVEYESPELRDISPQNSPLWKSDPDQQLSYYGVRAWARRHFPDVILGVYAPDETEPVRDDSFNPLAAAAHQGPMIEHEEAEYEGETASAGAAAEDNVADASRVDGGGDHEASPQRQKRTRKPKPQADPPVAEAEAQAAEHGVDVVGEDPSPPVQTTATEAGRDYLVEVKHALGEVPDLIALRTLWRQWKAVADDMQKNGNRDMAQKLAIEFQNRKLELEQQEQAKGGDAPDEGRHGDTQSRELSPAAETPSIEQRGANGAAPQDPYPWPDVVEEKVKLWPDHVRQMALYIWKAETEEELDQRYKETSSARQTFEPQARYAVSRALNYARDRIQGIER